MIQAELDRAMSPADRPDYDASYRAKMDEALAGMSAGQRFRAGLGSGALQAGNALLNTVNDLAEWIDSTAVGGAINRAGQSIGLPSTAEARQSQDAYRREVVGRDAALQDTTAGRVGGIVGAGAVLAPTALIPGAGTYGGAAAIGAGAGAALSESGERAGGAAIGAAGGVAGKALGDAVSNALRRAVAGIRSAVGRGGNIEQATRAAVQEALDANGVKLSDLPAEAQRALLAEVRAALNVGDVVDPAALGRKADFAALGAQPTVGMITRDPQQFAFEQTLAGVQGAGRELADTAQQNNRVLIEALNKAGAANAPGKQQAGQMILESGQKFWDVKNQTASQLWDAAKQQGGRTIHIDAPNFARAVDDKLAYELKKDFVPPKIAAMFERFRDGSVPLTVETAEQFKTVLATAARSPQLDGNEKIAVGIIRDALESAPLAAASASPADDAGRAAVAAFNQARAATRDLKNNVETIPAIKAAIGGAEPDKIFDKMVVGGDLADVRKLGVILKEDPEKLSAVKAQAVDFLKQMALNGASDEVGNFSQSAYNKALAQLTTNRLEALGFTQAEINTLKTVGRVSSYIQSQPAGSKVNNSNTAAQGYNLLLGLLSKIKATPVAGPLMAAEGLSEQVGKAAARNFRKAAVPTTRGASATDVVGRAFPAASGSSLLSLIGNNRYEQQ